MDQFSQRRFFRHTGVSIHHREGCHKEMQNFLQATLAVKSSEAERPDGFPQGDILTLLFLPH